MIQEKLKMEIIIGYLIWVSFFILIVYIVHDSWQKQSAMELQETHWQGKRQQTNQAFLSLLDLAHTGELIAGWTEEDYSVYQKKRVITVTLLQKLKVGQKDNLQRVYIDSVCNLLMEKERQMAALLQLLNNMPDAREIIHQKLPASALQNKKDIFLQKKTFVVENNKKNFWSFLRKQQKKSAYAMQWEERQKKLFPPQLSIQLEQV